MREAVPPLPQYAFMAWCLVKHRDIFTFYLYNMDKIVTSGSCEHGKDPLGSVKGGEFLQ
jgi:hypothetical protein